MTEQFPDDRAEQAARAWFEQQADAAAPPSIDPAAIRAAADRRRRLRFTRGLAAAAVLLAVLVIVPLALRPAGPPITGIPAPSAGASWRTTAPSPLSPRFGSLTAWLDGRYYLIGGWDGGPCPPGAECDMPGPNLRDGARYDPATDTWEKLAEVPFVAGRDWAQAAVADEVLYVRSADGVGDPTTWAYQPNRDQWRRVADPLDGGRLVATSSELFLSTYGGEHTGGSRHYVYRPDADAWEPLPDGPLDDCVNWRTLAADERLLVIGRCGEDGAELRTTFYDPATGTWTGADPIPGITSEPTSFYTSEDPVYAAGRLLWPDALSVVSSMRTPGIYDVAERTWQEVSLTMAPGGLSYRGMQGRLPQAVLTGPGLVEANGDLLDVRSAGWLEVPEAPVPDRWEPVVAVGPDALLSCFGYLYLRDSTRGEFADGCHLLTVGSTAPTSPTASPASPTATPTDGTGQAWREVASPDSDPRSDPLLVAVDDRFYLMGGYRPGLGEEDTQLESGYRFDPTGNTWTPIAALPQVALSHPYQLAADVVGETVYVHFTFEELGELWAYDTRADNWRKIADTDEAERFVGNADGLFRTRSVEPDDPFVLERLAGTTWQPVATSGPAPAGADGTIVVVDDHQLAWVTEQVSLLDTSTLLWQKPFLRPSGAHPELEPEVVGGAGSLVLVYKANRDSATPASLEVFTFTLGGEWQQRPASTDAGGLNWFAAGPAVGRWVIVHGNLLDPRTGEWHQVPEIPGDGGDWEAVWVAGGDEGALTCFPKNASDDAGYDAGCYLYPVAPEPATSPPAGAPEPSWRTVAPPDPEPRRSPLMVHANGSYYLMGGERGDAAGNGEPLRTAFRLDQRTWSWQPIADLPEMGPPDPYSMTAEVVGTTIYVHASSAELAESWAYDTVADSWRRIARTSEDQVYLATEDGVVRLTWGDQGYRTVPPELLVDGRWVELPKLPEAAPGWWRWVASPGDHRIAVVGDGRVTTLNTAARTWSAPSEPAPGDVVSRTMSSGFGVDGTMVVVGSSPAEEGFLVYRDGGWTSHRIPPTAGGGGFDGTGLTLGHRVVVEDWLFDPVTGAGRELPAWPGKDRGWYFWNAGDESGILSCYPTDKDLGPEASCAYLDLTG